MREGLDRAGEGGTVMRGPKGINWDRFISLHVASLVSKRGELRPFARFYGPHLLALVGGGVVEDEGTPWVDNGAGMP